MTDPELQNFFINEAGLALDGGDWFGTGGEGFARINIATPRKLLEEGLVRLEKSISHLKTK